MVNIMVQWMMTAAIALLHPFFVSVIEINHNAKDANVEISVRIFTEDLEKTLQKYATAKVDIINGANLEFIDKQINNYLTKKLILKVNGQPATLHYIGHEIQKESVWSYLEISGIKDMKKLEIDCTLLYDFEKAQSNIFHVKNGEKDKSYKLDFPKRTVEFAF